MAQTKLSISEAKETYIEGSLDLLLYLKKLLQQALDQEYKANPIPDELVSAYDQLVILLNNSISGLRLPASMVRTMLGDIRKTLMNHTNSDKPHHQEFINQLNALTNIYLAITKAEDDVTNLAKTYRQAGEF